MRQQRHRREDDPTAPFVNLFAEHLCQANGSGRFLSECSRRDSGSIYFLSSYIKARRALDQIKVVAPQPGDWQLADEALLLSCFGCQGLQHGWFARCWRWWRSHHLQCLQWLDQKNCSKNHEPKKSATRNKCVELAMRLVSPLKFSARFAMPQAISKCQNAANGGRCDPCSLQNNIITLIVPLTLRPRPPCQTPQACCWRIE